MSETEALHRAIYCSFCAKSQLDVETLVAGPGVQICNECVEVSVKAVADCKGRPVTPQTRFQDYWPTETLFRQLKGYERAVEAVDRSMQDAVDILREREVSWTRIGQALGVSKQAAWKRFC